MTTPVTIGTKLVAAERFRQIEGEGYTPDHDADHPEGDLLRAAMSYLTAGTNLEGLFPWPWSEATFKPVNGMLDLIKAGALIVAEIDRLVARAEGGADE